ncbi:hypothetical protein [Treponema sp.]|uniref:hypothetical protein n=1 Tax=Treponema sp. TaxID=166 RepID=UPI00298DF569|nr:hypothetical protein [Treponema sp.]
MKNYLKLAIVVLSVIFYIMYFIKSRPKKADVKTIEDALKKLLSANYKDKGFVIIEDFYEKQFVQLGLENYGLMLMWPNVKGQEENLIKVRKLFLNREYSESKEKTVTRKTVENLKHNEFVQDGSGLYANVGKDSNEIFDLIKKLFIEIYNYNDFDNMKIQLVLKNK